MTKLTRAAFMDAMNDWMHYEQGFSSARERAEYANSLWSWLVKRGLAEEGPRFDFRAGGRWGYEVIDPCGRVHCNIDSVMDASILVDALNARIEPPKD